MRRIFLALTGLLLLVGAAAGWLVLHPDLLRPVAERVAAAVTGRLVSIGTLDLRIEDGGAIAEVGAVRIGETTVEQASILLAGTRSRLRGSGVRLPSGSFIERFDAPLDLALSGRPKLSTVDAFGVVLVVTRGKPSDPPRPPPLARLLIVPRILLGFGLERLALHSAEVHYRGRELSRTSRVAAVLEAAQGGLAFRGELSAAGDGTPLPFSGTVRRPMHEDWEIDARLMGSEVPMAEVRRLVDVLEPSPRIRAALRRVSSETRFDLSARLARSRIEEIGLDFVFGPRERSGLKTDEARLELEGLRLIARAVPATDFSDWAVQGAVDWSGVPGGAGADPSPFTLHWRTGTSGSFRFAAERIAVPVLAAAVSQALPSGHALHSTLERLQPTGMIGELTSSRDAATGAGGAAAFRLGAVLSEFGAAAGEARIDGADARIEFDGGSWRVRLADERVRVAVPSVWRAPQDLTLQGEVRIGAQDGGLAAHTEGLEIGFAGITGRLAGAFTVSPRDGADDAAPRLDVEVRLRDTELEAVGAALPDRRATKFAEWYRRAARSGRLAGAVLRIRGDPRRMPFAAGDGEFTATGTVKDVEFAYARGWPAVRVEEAKVRASGPVLEFVDARGSLFDTAITLPSARIEDTTKQEGRVRLSLTGAGPAGDLLAFVRASPLGARGREAAADVRADGPVATTLELDVPYGRGARERPLGLSGEIELGGVAFRLADRRAVLEDVRGTLVFDPDGVSGGPLPGRFRGEEIESRVRFAPGTGLQLRFSGDGGRDWFVKALDDLVNLHAGETAPWLSLVHGRTAWEGEYDSRTGVTFRSDLRTASVDLPAPFGKPFGKPRPLEVFLAPGEARWDIEAGYGAGVRGVFEITETAGAWRLARGGIVLGEAPPALPDGGGIDVSGRLPEIDLDFWVAALSDGSGKPGPAAADWISRIGRIELETASARLLGRRLALRKLRFAPQRGGGFRIVLAGEGVAGEVSIPADRLSERAAVHLRRLHLGKPIEVGKNGPADLPDDTARAPVQWPSFDARIESLRFGRIDLGAVRVRGERTADGLEIDEIAVASPDLEVRGRGSWLALGGGTPVSRFTGKVNVRNPSHLLSATGLEGAGLSGRRIELRFDLAWPGTPVDPAPEHFEGEIELDAEDGRLPNVRMGPAGRLLALLNLDALPRVLAMDLSHVFGEGFVYDRIAARMHLEPGSAEIREFSMSGPSAVIEISGSIDLAARRYDQEISIIPRLTRSGALVPVWIATWPVLTGNFLLEKLTGDKPVLDRLFQLRYRLRGPWDDPEIERASVGPVQAKE